MENCGAYIKPEPFSLGPAEDERVVDGVVVKVPIELYGLHIPSSNVLKGFLELPGVLQDILSYVQHIEESFSETGPIENIMQGHLWKSIIKPKFNGKLVLPLLFSFDDYETNKELGTRTGVHKLGAGYIHLPCIPPRFRSQLENIFLALLIYSADKVVGNSEIFRKLISELKVLEESGISVVTPGGVYQIHFALCLVFGDNLGANGVLGFVECFSANFFCRLCTERKDITHYQGRANPEKKRTPLTYEQDLLVDNPKLTGRKGKCVFNELLSYHVAENVHCDTMHDLDEGVWKYLMTNIVHYLYVKRRFTLDYLNELIQGFYYGPNESRNKPPIISHDDLVKNRRLRFNASEMRCFVRYFALIVGHLICEEDKAVWDLYLKARQIIDILSAPIVVRSDVYVLENLIEEHHSSFIEIFQTHLLPKFHMLLHEPFLLSHLGPIDSLSCFRGESKHREGINVAKRSQNRVNLIQTIAKNHQLKLACRFIAARGFETKFNYSSVTCVHVETLHEFSKFASLVSPQFKGMWNLVKWLKTEGAEYHIKSVILVSVCKESRLPVFGEIKCISVFPDKKALFVVQLLTTVSFSKRISTPSKLSQALNLQL